jgi:ferredoxin-NADP reductase/nitrite reductase/ring-hydroxylating ferredoxin subunit
MTSSWTQISSTFPPNTDRIHTCINGRYVTVFRLAKQNNQLYCLDSTCYHAGGPLAIGDIEEVNGETCITCPWHDYPVVLKDGSKLYESLTMDPKTKKLIPNGWARKLHSQRTHQVEMKSDGSIWVQLNMEGTYDSDEYGTSVLCGERVARGDKSGATKGSDGKMPSSSLLKSGAVIQAARAKAVEWSMVKVAGEIKHDGTLGILVRFSGGPGTKRDERMMLTNAADLLDTKHLLFRVDVTADERNYTLLPPQMCDPPGEHPNEFQISVRLYPKRTDSTGMMLSRLKSGGVVHVSKPVKESSDATELRSLNLSPQIFTHIYLFAGGSGITALSSVLVNCMEHTLSAHITLVCVDSSPDTCMLRNSLARYVTSLGKQRSVKLIRVWTTTSKSTKHSAAIPGETSAFQPGHRLDETTLLDKILKSDLDTIKSGNKVLVAGCGPPGFFVDISGWMVNGVKNKRHGDVVVVGFW